MNHTRRGVLPSGSQVVHASSPVRLLSRSGAPPRGEEVPKLRAGTKQALLIEMLRRPEGTTIEQVIAATGWQAHTVRGAMSGALKNKLGLEVTSEKVETRGRVYRIRCTATPARAGHDKGAGEPAASGVIDELVFAGKNLVV